jgi:hypothetical protein
VDSGQDTAEARADHRDGGAGRSVWLWGGSEGGHARNVSGRNA